MSAARPAAARGSSVPFFPQLLSVPRAGGAPLRPEHRRCVITDRSTIVLHRTVPCAGVETQSGLCGSGLSTSRCVLGRDKTVFRTTEKEKLMRLERRAWSKVVF